MPLPPLARTITEIKADFLQSLIYDTASGSVATFSDGADNMPCKSVVAQIVPKQAGSGDPSPDNVRPISGWDAVTVERTGKNLWGGLDMARAFQGKTNAYTLDETAKTFTYSRSISTTPQVIYKAPFKANTQYTLLMTYSSTGNNGSLRVDFTDGTSTTLLFQEASSKTTVAKQLQLSGKTVSGISLGWNTTGLMTVYYEESGLFEGVVTADDFKPYTGSAYSVSLPQTVYGGEVDVVSGEGKATYDIVDLGTLTWEFRTDSIYRTLKRSDMKIVTNSEKANWLCSKYKTVRGGDFNYGYDCIIGMSNTSYIYVRDTAFADGDAEAFKSAMSGVLLVYELAEPTDFTIISQEVPTLYGSNTVYADSGDVAVEYPADTKLYISRLTEPDSSDMIADANIVSGKYFMVGNDLYLATANIANGGAIVPGTNCTKVSLATALNAINS